MASDWRTSADSDYRSENRLTQVTEGTTTDFTYVGLSLQSLSATWTDGGTPETTESWKLTYLYDEYGKPYAGIYRSSTDDYTPVFFGLLTTDRGDVVALLDKNGSPFAAYRYDAWGNPQGAGTEGTTGIWWQATLEGENEVISLELAETIAQRQVLRYAGYCHDSESGMYYLSARHYDPATRQFLSKDLSRNDGEQSAYGYCLGNPVKNVDPTGYWSAEAEAYRVACYKALRAGQDSVARSCYRAWTLFGKDGYTQQQYEDCARGFNGKGVQELNKRLTKALQDGTAHRTDRDRYYVEGVYTEPKLTDAEDFIEHNPGTVGMLQKAMEKYNVPGYLPGVTPSSPYALPVRLTVGVYAKLVEYCEVAKYAYNAVTFKQSINCHTPLLAALDFRGDSQGRHDEGFHESDRVLMWLAEQWAHEGWVQQ